MPFHASQTHPFPLTCMQKPRASPSFVSVFLISCKLLYPLLVYTMTGMSYHSSNGLDEHVELLRSPDREGNRLTADRASQSPHSHGSISRKHVRSISISPSGRILPRRQNFCSAFVFLCSLSPTSPSTFTPSRTPFDDTRRGAHSRSDADSESPHVAPVRIFYLVVEMGSLCLLFTLSVYSLLSQSAIPLQISILSFRPSRTRLQDSS